MYSLGIGILIRTNSLWAEVNSVLRDLPFRVVSDIHQTEKGELSVTQIAQAAPDIMLVEIPDELDAGRRLIAKVKEAARGAVVVAVHATPGVEAVITSMRAGASEFLHAPLADNLKVFLDRMQASYGDRPQGTAVGFVSVKGGCGSSTIACHSAVALGARLEKEGKRALLMDLDFSSGVDGFILKAKSEYSILEAIKNLRKLDISYWNSLVCRTHPGLDVLAAPASLPADFQLKGGEIQYVLGFALRYYNRVILDFGRGLGQIASSLLSQLSELYLVATNEILPLYMTRQMLPALETSGFPRERVRLVLNRLPRSGSNVRDVEKALGFPVALTVPNDYESLHECYSSGKLLPESSAVAAQMRSVVACILGEPIERPTPFYQRVFRRLPHVRGSHGDSRPEGASEQPFGA
jgi:pilus assembly protein CpaE